MSEFGRLLLFAAGLIAIILVGVPVMTFIETGSISATIATSVFLVACCVWGWVAGGIDYRNEKK